MSMGKGSSKAARLLNLHHRLTYLVSNQNKAAASLSAKDMVSQVSLDDAIEWLAAQRRRPDRQSAKVVQYGNIVLESGKIKRLGDDTWSFLEQVALAALDLGQIDLAELCVSRLNTRFPQSARVQVLQGMLLEARSEWDKAYRFYDGILTKDDTKLVIVKRLVTVLKSMDPKDARGGPARAIEALNKYLDTYYSDVEAWQELAALYTEQHMYSQAAFALEELILLAPHNTFFVLQYAETLATAGEQASAYKQYLRVLEMCNDGQGKEATDPSSTRNGPLTRALWGLKLVTSKLLAPPQNGVSNGSKNIVAKSTSNEEQPEKVQAVDALVTHLLLNQAYRGNSQGIKTTREVARRVLQAAV